MKTLSVWVALSWLLTLQSQGQTTANSAPIARPNVTTNDSASQTIVGYQIGTQDGNSRVWQKIVRMTDPQGNVTYQTNRAYVELATGLNHLVGNQWVASKEEIDISADGNSALATNGQHQVYFPGDIYNGKIELVTPDGKQLYSRPVGLSYFDGTNSVLIAELTNSTGEVVGDNQVVYPNAFTGFKADIRYTYTMAGFEQDIILRERPPTPASYGLNPDTTRLEVLTEFFNPPQPKVNASTIPTVAGNLENDQLNFGSMTMGQGKAFLLGTTTPSAEVNKQWLMLDGAQFLVEEVPVVSIADELENLPLPSITSARPNSPLNVVSTKRLLPEHRLATVLNKHPMQLAQVTPSSQGLVLDYNTVNGSLTNYTFQGDTTYYISGVADLYGTNTFEGGAVLKYTNGAYLELSEVVTYDQATAYRPVIFTAMDDNSVGETISGSTGNPTNYYANPAIYFTTPGGTWNFNNFRIAYADKAISISSGYNLNVNLQDGQIVNCETAIYTSGQTTLGLENMLLADVQIALELGQANVQAQNVTFTAMPHGPPDYPETFLVTPVSYPFPTNTINLTNCILANFVDFNFTTSFTLNADYCGFYNNEVSPFGTSPITAYSDPFQTVGAGSYYLTNGCNFLNAGTTNIDPTLLADLATKTTWPPMVYSNVVITNNLTLGPQAQRDNTGAPDLGYHYDPLDYVFGGSDLYTNLDFSAGTAVAWFESQGGVYSYYQPYGLSINDGAKVSFHGTATQPDWFLRFNLVQEGNGNWLTSGWMPGLMLNGSGSAPLLPEINATFTKWSGANGFGEFFRDAWNYGVVHAANSEFYIAGYASYAASMYFTNCLFDRDLALIAGDTDSANMTYLNCTFHDGAMLIKRYNYYWDSPSFWLFENCAFDGTLLITYDQLDASTNSTEMDYNCYNPSNSSWMTYPYSWYGAPSTNVLEVVGPHDIMVTNYDWQSSWFGNYYLPSDSRLIDAGSTNANLLGLYHFTTQTNQVPETNSIVDIGYHYVATDAYGNPLDSNGDGIPDYLEDANGNGLVDSGEIGWNISGDLGLNVIITRPRNGSIIP